MFLRPSTILAALWNRTPPPHKLGGDPDPHPKKTHIRGLTMDDTCCHNFFTDPTGPRQRRYEALRAVFVDRRPQKQVADQFGYTYGSLRQLVHEFRTQCRRAAPPPFFSPSPGADPTARTPSRRPPAP